MDPENYEVFKMDFHNLMSCIDCHKDAQNLEVILETLKTITDICSSESCGKDAFRETGGLDYLLDYISSTSNTFLLEHLLKTLAFVIDENIHNQMHMTKIQVFEVLQVILKSTSFPINLHKNALLLLSAVMFQNSAAQSLTAESGLIQDLLIMYEDGCSNILKTSSSLSSVMEKASLDLWLSLSSSLCFAVNNPQNEKNQELCSVVFTVALKIMENSLDKMIVCSTCSFLSLCISNNVKNQDKFAECDGLLILKRCFQKYFDSLVLDAMECNNVIGKGTLQILNNIIGIISAVATDHERNAAVLGKLGIINLMIKLLFVEIIDITLKTRIILSLGHCIDACTGNKVHVLESENFDIFLKESVSLGNMELRAACMYLLQLCLSDEGCTGSCVETPNDELISSESTRNNSPILKFGPVKSSHTRVNVFRSPLKNRNIDKKSFSDLSVSKLKEKCDNSFDSKRSIGSVNMKLDRNYLNVRRNKNIVSKGLYENSLIFKKSQSFNKHEGYSSSNLQQLNRIFQQSKSENDRRSPTASKCSESFIQCATKKPTSLNKWSMADLESENFFANNYEIPQADQGSSSVTDTPSNKSSVSRDVQKCSVEFTSLSKIGDKLESFAENKPNSQNSAPVTDKNNLKKPCILNNFKKEKFKDITSEINKSDINSFKFMLKPVLSDRTNVDTPCSTFMQNNTMKQNLRTFENNHNDSNFTLKFPCTKMESVVIQKEGLNSFKFNVENSGKFHNSSINVPHCHQRHQSLPSQDDKLRNLNIIESCASIKSAITSVSKRKKKKEHVTSSHSQKRSHKFQQRSDSNSYMKVVVLPGETCEEHGLIASFEMLKVIPIDDA